MYQSNVMMIIVISRPVMISAAESLLYLSYSSHSHTFDERALQVYIHTVRLML